MALGVDRAREDVMRRGPRSPDASILDARVLGSLFPTAAIMAVATLWVLSSTDPATQFTMAFTTFVLLQLGNVLAVRGSRSGVLGRQMFTNRWVWAAVGLVLVVQVGVVHLGFMQELFETTALSLQQWLVAGGLGLLPIVVAEATRRLRRGAPAAEPQATA
jgi:Ca2+-transporting ATPase